MRSLLRLAGRAAGACVVLFASIALSRSPALADGLPPAYAKWSPWLEISGAKSNLDEATRGELAFWGPLVQNRSSLLFVDVRGKWFEDAQREGNFALGFRGMQRWGWNFGMWVGYDRRLTETGSTFDQISLGVEALAPLWEFRMNGYVPLQQTKTIGPTVPGAPDLEMTAGTIVLVNGATEQRELALWGIDAELGFRVPLGLPDRAARPSGLKDALPFAPLRHELWLYGGGFYFDHRDLSGEMFGPKVRAEWRVENVIPRWAGSRLTFEAAYRYDDIRRDQYEAGIRLRLPISDERNRAAWLALSPQERRMNEGLKRDTD
jgi:hypothetical protein